MAAGVFANYAIPSFARGGAVVEQIEPATTSALSLFGYGQVQLAPGPLQTQFEENHKLLLSLSEDSLLRPYRIREGLPAPGTDLGGWYDTNAFAPGFTYGQWMSALARFYAATGDAATRDKINRLIAGYAATISTAGKFYEENRFPAYIYDKLVLGLIDAHTYAGSPAAFHTLDRATDAAWSHLPPHAMPHQEAPLVAREDFTEHVWDESYTISENLFLAAQRTGNPRYLEMAKRYLFDSEYYDPLSRGENVLPGRHAYSHMNSLSSAAAAYLALGSEKHLRAAKNGFAFVHEQSYATGGWGPDEHFVVPGSSALFDSLTKTHASFETPCGSYAHFKLTRYLLRITKDPGYGDSMERVLYNTILGAKPLTPSGDAFYYADNNFDGSKFYHQDKWPCCSGTLPQIAADYRISAYFQDARGIYVNLYLPSTLIATHSKASISLTQTTEYPYDSHIRLDFAVTKPTIFSLFLRIPEWAKGASLAVNGMRDSQELAPGTFAELRREWKASDRVELNLPLTQRLEPIDARHPNTVALVCGPLVLMPLKSTQTARITRGTLFSAKQSFARSRLYAAAVANSFPIQFKAFPDIGDEHYATYVTLSPA